VFHTFANNPTAADTAYLYEIADGINVLRKSQADLYLIPAGTLDRKQTEEALNKKRPAAVAASSNL
jgi:hypothetical protein